MQDKLKLPCEIKGGVSVLSLFDGMSCGMLAFLKLGIEPSNYYAYEIDKYAIKTTKHNFPNIKQCGDVFEANFTQYEGIDYLIGGSPCVPANSKIKTDKGYKRIADIQIGDMVLTHKNRYKPVSRLYKRKSNHLYHIKFCGNKTIDITGNHPVYTYRNGNFCFVRTDELTTDDYVCVNINQKSKKLDYSGDMFWLVGRAIADGFLSKEKNCVVISVGKNKIEEFENHLCGIDYYITHKDRPAPEYYIKSNKLTELYSYFGNKKATEKYVPDAILDLPKEQLSQVWNGYISGDGFKRKDKPNTVMWSSSSEDLILSLGLVTSKLFGKYPTTSIRNGGYKILPSGLCYTNTNFNSQISITNRKNKDLTIIGDKLLVRIKSIEKEFDDIDVYNIETATDHTYTVDNIIVHNCTYWSIAQSPDKRETTASGLGWELFSQYVRALNEAKPKYFLYENNKSMSKAIYKSISDTFGFEPILINSALVSAQNRNRYYWCGKRNEDGTYSKVDIPQPEDRGILLKDILEGNDLTSCDKGWTLTASYGGAVAWNMIERHQRNMVVEPVNTTNDGKSQTIKAQYQQTSVANICKYTSTYGASGVAEPVGTTKDEKSYCLTSGYANGSGENIGNYAAHTLEKGCKSMVAEEVEPKSFSMIGDLDNRKVGIKDKAYCLAANPSSDMSARVIEPINTTADGKAQCLRATCYKDTVRNIVGNDVDRKTGVAESVRVGALPRLNGKLSTSQAMRVYSTEGKSVNLCAGNLCAGSGGMGGKTGLYAVPIDETSKTVLKGIDKVADKVGYVPEMFNAYNGTEIIDKSPTLTTGSMETSSCATNRFENIHCYATPVEFDGEIPTKAISYADGKTYTVYTVKGGQITIKGKTYPIKLKDGYYIIRKLTVSECKRLQTVPEWYDFSTISQTQAYKCLGNGWTVDVIAHILKGLLNTN